MREKEGWVEWEEELCMVPCKPLNTAVAVWMSLTKVSWQPPPKQGVESPGDFCIAFTVVGISWPMPGSSRQAMFGNCDIQHCLTQH